MIRTITSSIYLILIAILVVSTFTVENAFATAAITLTPTKGNTGSTVTVNGSGFTPSTTSTIQPGSAKSDGSWFGKLWTEEFTGLPSGQVIGQLALDFAESGTGNYNPVIGAGAISRTDGVWYNQTQAFEFSGLIGGGTLNKVQFYISANGTGTFTSTINAAARSDGVWNNALYLEEYTGFSKGAQITKVSLDIQATGGGQAFVAIYDDSGAGGTPGNRLAYSITQTIAGTGTQTFTLLTPASVPTDGKIYAAFQLSSSTANIYYSLGGTSYQVNNNYASGAPAAIGSYSTVGALFWSQVTYEQSGAVRIKIYDDTGTSGAPGSLLGETSSLLVQVPTNTLQNFTLPSGIHIPSDGNIYVALESNDTLTQFWYQANSGTDYYVKHTYGSGPNPFGTASSTTSTVYSKLYYNATGHVRIKIYDDTGSGGTPGNLLGESGSLPVAGLPPGYQNFTVQATIPSDGKVWAGFEIGNINMNMIYTYPVTPAIEYVSHTYGSGPTAFGTGTSTSNSLFFAKLTYQVGALTYKWDSTGLTTTPADPLLDSSGKFSGVTFNVPSSSFGLHTITTSDSVLSATATFNDTSISSFTQQFSMWYSDLSNQIISGKIIQTNSGTSITKTLNGTGWASFTVDSSKNYNYTFIDNSNTFVVKQLINNSTSKDQVIKQPTYETPYNCIGSQTGVASDFIIEPNDTSGTHITSFSKITCPNSNELDFNITYTGNGLSSLNQSAVMKMLINNNQFQGNPKDFEVNGATIPTSYLSGPTVLTNPYSVGSGTGTNIVKYVIKLFTSGALPTSSNTGSGATGGGVQPSNQNTQCLFGVWDASHGVCTTSTPQDNCKYGTNPDGTCYEPYAPTPNPNGCTYGINPDGTCYQPTSCQYGINPDGTCTPNPTQYCSNGVNADGSCYTPTSCQYGTNPDGTCASKSLPNCNNGYNADGTCFIPPPPPNNNPDPTQNPSNPFNPSNPITGSLLSQLLGGGGGDVKTLQGITYSPTNDVLQLGQIKDESIGVTWPSGPLTLENIFVDNSSQFVINPNPIPPYTMTVNSGISTQSISIPHPAYASQSSGQIKYMITVPNAYCGGAITTNCLNPNLNDYTIPVDLVVSLNGTEVKNTLLLKFTILKTQDIATWTILALIFFAVVGLIARNFIDKYRKTKKRTHRYLNRSDSNNSKKRPKLT